MDGFLVLYHIIKVVWIRIPGVTPWNEHPLTIRVDRVVGADLVNEAAHVSPDVRRLNLAERAGSAVEIRAGVVTSASS